MPLNTTAAAMANETLSGLEDTLPKKVIKVLMYCILFVVSLTGNLLIVWATSRDSRLRSTTNILIANMAVSDLLFALIAVPRQIVAITFSNSTWLVDGDFGLALCKITAFLQDISTGVSIYSCVFIALDRFYAVVYPLRGGLSRGKLKYIIPGIWTFSMAMLATYFITFRLVETRDSIKCINDLTRIGIKTVVHLRIYVVIMCALNAAIPLPIICFLYLRIALKLRRTTVPGQAGNTSSVRERQNKNALKMSAVVITLVFLSWLPYMVFVLLHFFGNLGILSPIEKNDLLFSGMFIAHSSCCYNFFIYLVFTEVYRQNFRNWFSKCCSCVNRSQVSSLSQISSLALENMGTDHQGEVTLNAVNELD